MSNKTVFDHYRKQSIPKKDVLEGLEAISRNYDSGISSANNRANNAESRARNNYKGNNESNSEAVGEVIAGLVMLAGMGVFSLVKNLINKKKNNKNNKNKK